MLISNFQLEIVNLITPLKRDIEEALKQVVSKQTPNYSTKLLGKQMETFTPILSELSTETGLINQSLSTSQLSSTLLAECLRSMLSMMFKMLIQIRTGNREWQTLKSMLQFKELSTLDQKLKFDIIIFVFNNNFTFKIIIL